MPKFTFIGLLTIALTTWSIQPIDGAPTKNRKVVLVSMDGFRYDYINKTYTPNFDKMIASGVTVPYVNNAFVTLTFPSHYTIVTGRYEESHGIVGNKMYDPVFNSTFDFGNTETRWWDGAEPVWINAVKAGLKAGVYFWPGSDSKLQGLRPSRWLPYDGSVKYKDRIDVLVDDWLVMNDFEFGIIYFDEPDHSGHKYGPDAPEMLSVIQRMDDLLGYFMLKLEQKNIKDNVDVILTSDHGMTAVDQDQRLIGIMDYVDDTLLLDLVGGGAVAHLRPQPGKTQELVNALSGIHHMTVYLKEDIPEKYHYKNNRRVMPVVAVANEGWEIRKTSSVSYKMKGNHGYNNEFMSMKPIFVASGPSFKRGMQHKPIESVDIYPLLCHLLDLQPAPNNGSFSRVKDMLNQNSNNAAISHISSFSFVVMCTIVSYI